MSKMRSYHDMCVNSVYSTYHYVSMLWMRLFV